MANIVDELVVLLNLDATKFKKGEQEATASLKRLREGADRHGKETEKRVEGMSAAVGTLSGKLLGLAGLFLGGLGMKKFAEDVTNVAKAMAELGRTAAQAGTTAQSLKGWEMAGARVGASAGEIAGSVQSLRSALEQFRITGNSPIVQYFNQMGIGLTGANGKIKDTTALLKDMNKWAQGRDKAFTAEWFREMGMSQGMINLLQQPPAKLGEYLAWAKKFAPTDAEVKNLTEAQSAFTRLTESAKLFGELVTRDVAPLFAQFANFLATIVELAAKLPRASGETVKQQNEHYGPDAPSGWETLKRWWGGARSPIGEKLSDLNPIGSANAMPTQGLGSTRNAAGRTNIVRDTAQQFRDASVPESGVAAILANVQRESGFNPNSRVADQPKFGGEAHYAHGLYQEGGTEWNNYAAWLGKKYPGRAWQDHKAQTEFLIENLQKNYPKVWAALNDPNLSAGQKAMIFQSGYLRPARLHPGDASVAEGYLRNPPPSPPVAPGQLGSASPSGDFKLPWVQEPGVMSMLKAGNVSTTNNRTNNEVHLGGVNINSSAVDAYGIARDLKPVLEMNKFMNKGNYGPN